MKILSWNVNGIRSAAKKGFLEWFAGESPDILCLQEVKAQPSQVGSEILEVSGYHVSWNAADRLGYSGVATYTKRPPLNVVKGFGIERFDAEGRVLQTEFKEFTLLNIYFPNGGMNDERLRYKMDFYGEALKFFLKLRKKGRKLVISGDYNTAHKPIDLKNPKENEDVSGFLPMEREWLDKLIAAGFVDTFRHFSREPGHYTWWDMRTRARERNAGWRIDYHFVSEDLKGALAGAFILPDVQGSDHCPAGLLLTL